MCATSTSPAPRAATTRACGARCASSKGAWLSNVALERSKQRLQRLAFVESVEQTTEQVPGSPDLVDVNFAVKERPSATIGGGIGYSAAQKLVLNGNLSDSNFFGGGDFVSLNVDSGAYNKIYSFSRDRSVSQRRRPVAHHLAELPRFDPVRVASPRPSARKNIALGLTYGYPITEYQGISAGVSLQRIDLLTFAASSAAAGRATGCSQNGHPYAGESVSTFIEPDGTTITSSTALAGTRYHDRRADRRLAVRFAQPRLVRRSRPAQRR